MLSTYIQAAMRRAVYDRQPHGGSVHGRIPALEGVWADAERIEDCEIELRAVLEEWLALRIAERLDIPPLDGITVRYGRTACCLTMVCRVGE